MRVRLTGIKHEREIKRAFGNSCSWKKRDTVSRIYEFITSEDSTLIGLLKENDRIVMDSFSVVTVRNLVDVRELFLAIATPDELVERSVLDSLGLPPDIAFGPALMCHELRMIEAAMKHSTTYDENEFWLEVYT